MKVLAVVASTEGGTTHTLVGEVLAGAAAKGAAIESICLGHGPYRKLELASFDALVLGTPIYRATYAGVLKDFLDALERGRPEAGFAGPLAAKPVAVVGTGASDHHFLGIDPLLALLTRFFSAYVVPPALYGRADQLSDPSLLDAARELGAATAALAAAVGADGALGAQRPQV